MDPLPDPEQVSSVLVTVTGKIRQVWLFDRKGESRNKKEMAVIIFLMAVRIFHDDEDGSKDNLEKV